MHRYISVYLIQRLAICMHLDQGSTNLRRKPASVHPRKHRGLLAYRQRRRLRFNLPRLPMYRFTGYLRFLYQGRYLIVGYLDSRDMRKLISSLLSNWIF